MLGGPVVAWRATKKATLERSSAGSWSRGELSGPATVVG